MPSSKPLAEYARKRDFRQTPEPSGRKPRKDSTGLLRYCVQKHDASRLHYDFRLELDGTLKSWAVPKGPCLDPAVKRLAVQVEDHPLDYADFEGSIPQGHYGAGDVIVWDRGAWTPLDDPREGLEKGHLSFALDGEKLSGRWHLIRTNLRGKQPQWFLVKAKDGEARSLDRFDVLKERPDSVLSERTLLPRHGETATPAARPARRGKSGGKTPMPEWIAPELASLVEQPPRGEWAYELKLDGYRLMSRIEDGHVRLLTRNGHDWTERLPHLEKAWPGSVCSAVGWTANWSSSTRRVDRTSRPCRTPSRKVAARTSCTSSSTCRTTKARICAMSPWRSAARAWRRCWKGETKTRCGSPRRSRKTPATCWPAPASSVSKA